MGYNTNKKKYIDKTYGSKQLKSADIKKNPKLAKAYEETYGSSWADQLDNARLYGMSDKTMRRLSGKENKGTTPFQTYMKNNPKANPKDTIQMKRANVMDWTEEAWPGHWKGSPIPKTQSKPATKTQSKPAAKTQSKPATKTQSKPAAKTQSKPATKTQSKPAAKTQSKPATKTQSKKK